MAVAGLGLGFGFSVNMTVISLESLDGPAVSVLGTKYLDMWLIQVL